MKDTKFLEQTSKDYGLELWEVESIYRRCYVQEISEYDIDYFYELLESSIVSFSA